MENIFSTHSEGVTAVATVALAFLTLALCFSSYALLKWTVRACTPIVTVGYEPHQRSNVVRLAIHNVGNGLAKEVRVTPSETVTAGKDGKSFDELASFFNQNQLRPGEAVQALVGCYSDIEPREVGFRIAYRDHWGRAHQSHVVLDVDQLALQLLAVDDDLSRIAKSVSDINHSLGRVVSTSRNGAGLNVYVSE